MGKLDVRKKILEGVMFIRKGLFIQSFLISFCHLLYHRKRDLNSIQIKNDLPIHREIAVGGKVG